MSDSSEDMDDRVLITFKEFYSAMDKVIEFVMEFEKNKETKTDKLPLEIFAHIFFSKITHEKGINPSKMVKEIIEVGFELDRLILSRLSQGLSISE